MYVTKKTSAVPRLFISSTREDLQSYREAAKEVAIRAGFFPEMMEYFETGRSNPPLKDCIERVRNEADALLVIVAHRYGWVPSDDWKDGWPLGQDLIDRSITWIECEAAAQIPGMNVFVLILSDEQDWPPKHFEEFKLRSLAGGDEANPQRERILRNVRRLADFKAWLGKRFGIEQFTTVDSMKQVLQAALDKWMIRSHTAVAPSCDPKPFLQWMVERHNSIQVPCVGSKPARRVAIDELFVRVRAKESQSGRSFHLSADATEHRDGAQKSSEHSRLLIVGGPGSGKTTLLKKLAVEQAHRALHSDNFLLPIHVRIGHFASHIDRFSRMMDPGPETPSSPDAPAWLSHFLWIHTTKDGRLNLSREFFEDRFRRGECMLLLDGLDEADPAGFASLANEISRAYPRCPLVITTRPGTRHFLEDGNFKTLEVQPLNRHEIKTFLAKWSILQHPRSPDRAQQFVRRALERCRQRQDWYELFSNPAMLTILAALWSGDHFLGDNRDALYESIVDALVRSRQDPRNGERFVEALQGLALAMQIDPGGRKTVVSIDWAAEKIAPILRTPKLQPAVDLLEREPAISGVIIVAEPKLSFWHLSLQDFLVARALSSRLEREQNQILRTSLPRLFRDEWREPLMFLAERLASRNPERFSKLLTFLLSHVGDAEALDDQARALVLLYLVAERTPGLPSPFDQQEYKMPFDRLRPVVFSNDIKSIAPSLRVEIARCYGGVIDSRLASLDWVSIPQAVFSMGAQKKDRNKPRFDEHSRDDEQPVRQVHVPAFAITRFPVTIAQYRQFIEDSGYRHKEFWGAGGFERFRSPSKWEEQLSELNCPVVGVSWFEAAAFCQWAGARLPEETEWERVAAGPEGRRFPWGNELPNSSRAYFDAVLPKVAATGIFPEGQTPEGIFDLAGNAWEWTASTYAPYGAQKDTRHSATRSLDRKVIRGGTTVSSGNFLRNAARAWAARDQRFSSFGPVSFRCARAHAD